MIQAVLVDPVDQETPHQLLDLTLPAQRGAEARPEVVVLSHAVVDPAGVTRVLDGVGWKTQGDDAVDLFSVAGFAQVGVRCGDVGLELPPKAILRRQHKVCFVTVLEQSGYQLARYHQVAALHERHIRRNDYNPLGHYRLVSPANILTGPRFFHNGSCRRNFGRPMMFFGKGLPI